MIGDGKSRAFARMFGSAVIMQALLSATNLIVGLILIRRTPDDQYGYYVLILTTILLVTTLQNAFIQSHMVVRMTGATDQGRADLVGGLFRDQRRMWPVVAAIASVTILVCELTHLIDYRVVWVALAATAAVLVSLFREFFRMVLLAMRRPEDVLKADAIYAVLLIAGAVGATYTPAPAAVAAAVLATAAFIGGMKCHASLWRIEPWNIRGAPGVLMAIAPLGAWTAAGSAIHWLFSQGYNFLVAGTLGVGAVAALSATRILIMPVNLLSSGIGTMMLPTVSGWLQQHSVPKVFRRQLLIAGSLALGALFYFAVLWLCRDWLFRVILKKSLPQRDLLMLLWFGVGLLMLLRDQLIYMLLSRSRFRILTVLTFVSAVASLTTSYFAMHGIFGMPGIGASGALVGVLAGEMVNVTGLVLLSIEETKKSPILVPA